MLVWEKKKERDKYLHNAHFSLVDDSVLVPLSLCVCVYVWGGLLNIFFLVYIYICVFVLNVVGLFSKTLYESEVFESLHEGYLH